MVGIEETKLQKEGKDYIIRSMALNVGFKNVDIKPYNIVEEELERFKSDS